MATWELNEKLEVVCRGLVALAPAGATAEDDEDIETAEHLREQAAACMLDAQFASWTRCNPNGRERWSVAATAVRVAVKASSQLSSNVLPLCAALRAIEWCELYFDELQESAMARYLPARRDCVHPSALSGNRRVLQDLATTPAPFVPHSGHAAQHAQLVAADDMVTAMVPCPPSRGAA